MPEAWYTLLKGSAKMKNKSTKILSVLSLILAVLFITISQINPVSQTKTPSEDNADILTVHYLDVGQADCTYVELPNGENLLIDAASSKNSFQIIDYLKSLGCDKINYAVATHPHADHIGGMSSIISEFKPEKFYMPNVYSTSKTFENLLDTLETCNTDVNIAEKGNYIINDKNLKIKFLFPNTDVTNSDLNNASAVIKITYKKTSFLFMADAESKVEKQLLSSDIDSDVLKIGHHGSANSSCDEFIKKVNPKIAVISCGKNNQYGHPSEKTLSILHKNNIDIIRTDINGTAVITSDGINVETDIPS